MDAARITRAAKSLAARLPALDKVRRLGDSPGTDVALIQAARAEARRAVALHEKERARLQAAADRAASDAQLAESEQETVRRLDEAARTVDRVLLAPRSLDTRLTQGLANVWSGKLDLLIAQAAETTHRRTRKGIEVRLTPEAVAQVRDRVTAGFAAWFTYVQRGLARDLTWTVFDATIAIDRDLPLPRDTSFTVAAPWPTPEAEGWWSQHELPDLSRTVPMDSFIAELWRALRGQFFLVAGLLTIAGLARETAYLVALPGLIPIVWFVVNRDRARRLEEARTRAEEALRTQVSTWAKARLDNLGPKLRDHCEEELRGTLRPAWSTWYRAEVVPRAERAKESKARAERESREARDALSRLAQDHPARDLAAFLDACEEAGEDVRP